jgi:hypothetical protein
VSVSNSPSFRGAGAAGEPGTHWRGDRTNLENQVFQALTSPITSGQPDEKAVIDRLARIRVMPRPVRYMPEGLLKAGVPERADG